MNGSTFVITGGTGSFGTTMLRRLLREGVSEIRILSRDEKKQDDLRKSINHHPAVKFHIGDVRDAGSVKSAIRGADFVFHAAALKQVPSCDFFPMQAVQTNILGASNVLRASQDFSIKKLVVLSTDKAVYPVNAMGMSKALMEKVMVAESRHCRGDQIFCGTRYGNVIASRGSVVPLFIRQVLENGEVTITEPTMTRFLMSLDEASELVLYAFDNGNQGDIFVQKSPAATVETIAKAVIKMLGKSEDEINIRILGARHGEKLHETLVSQEDMPHVEDLPNYYRIPADNRNLDYTNFSLEGRLKDASPTYASNTDAPMSVDETAALLLRNAEVQAVLKAYGHNV